MVSWFHYYSEYNTITTYLFKIVVIVSKKQMEKCSRLPVQKEDSANVMRERPERYNHSCYFLNKSNTQNDSFLYESVDLKLVYFLLPLKILASHNS